MSITTAMLDSPSVIIIGDTASFNYSVTVLPDAASNTSRI